MNSAEEINPNVLDLIPVEFRERVKIIDLPAHGIQEESVGHAIGICSGQGPSQVLDYATKSKIHHVCQSNSTFLSEEIATASRMIVCPDDFMKYPLSTILQPQYCGAKAEAELRGHEVTFAGADDKKNVLGELVQWLRSFLKADGLIAEVSNIGDELFMNAVYNAPFLDSSGKLQEVKGDSPEVRFGKGKQAVLFAGAHDKQLVIGCSDYYGTLNVERLLHRIKSCFDSGVAENINWSGVGGAGIGSFMVYNLSVSYYVGVRKGNQTVVCCKIPYGMSSRRRGEEPKNIHFFEY